MEEVNNTTASRYLEFSLGDEFYALPLLDVREVIAVPQTTPVPYMPSHFIGIMNLRGQVISVLDLNKKMGIKERETNTEEAVVVLDLGEITIGVKVGSVNSVLQINESQISEPPAMEKGTKTDYMKGVFRGDTKMTIIIDIRRLLNLEEKNFLSQKAAA